MPYVGTGYEDSFHFQRLVCYDHIYPLIACLKEFLVSIHHPQRNKSVCRLSQPGSFVPCRCTLSYPKHVDVWPNLQDVDQLYTEHSGYITTMLGYIFVVLICSRTAITANPILCSKMCDERPMIDPGLITVLISNC